MTPHDDAIFVGVLGSVQSPLDQRGMLEVTLLAAIDCGRAFIGRGSGPAC